MNESPGRASIFNTHVEVIAAPAAAVWAMFLDRSQWMESFVSRKVINGVDGVIGEISEVRMNVPSSPLRIEELIHMDLFRRHVVRISAPPSDALTHADFIFEDHGSRCRLLVSIHTFLGSKPPLPMDTLRKATDEKLRLDFARLREAVEGNVAAQA